MTERVWITWENQRRNKSLSAKLGSVLYEFDVNAPFFIRYPIVISKTIAVVLKERPVIIFAQNPSLVLAVLSTVLARIFNKILIIDAHNAGLFPLEGRSSFLNWIASKVCKWSDVTIVSNIELEKYVSSLGGKAISIPDPVPEIKPPKVIPKLQGTFNILFICSWAEDEPFLKVIEAARRLDNQTCIYITGRSNALENKYSKNLPDNVILTGYVSEEDFSGLLYACDSVMALTYRENCLLCGAYEGVAVGKPLILSNTKALKNHFRKGSVYTENNPKSIAEAINATKQDFSILSSEITALKYQHDEELVDTLKDFESYIEQLKVKRTNSSA